MLSLIRVCASLCALSLLALMGGAANAEALQSGEGDARVVEKREQQLERWRAFDPETRKEMLRRFERVQKLSPEERQRLLERATQLQTELDSTRASLSVEERTAMDALSPRERRRALQALVGDQARAAAVHLQRYMTSKERTQLEGATPRERAGIMRQVRERSLAELPERVAAMAREIGLGAGELERANQGTASERRTALVRLLRRRAQKSIDEGGLPVSVTKERAERLLKLDDKAFVRAFQRVRLRHPEFGISPKRWAALSKRRSGIARRLESLSVPTREQRSKWAGSPRIAIRRRVVLANRERLEKVMIERLPLPEDLAVHLRSMDDTTFVRAYRIALEGLYDGADVEAVFRRKFNRRR